jgi:tetratricopeptide (TPR) repeat protein
VNIPVGDRLTLLQLLEDAAAELKEGVGLDQQPELKAEAELRETIGQAYEYLGSPIQAEPHYARAWKLRSRLLSPDHPKTLALRNRQVRTVAQQGRLPDAEPMAQGAYDACMRALGERNAATAEATNNLGEVRVLQARYDEAVALRRRVSRVAEDVLGPDENMTLEITSDLSVWLARAGRPAEAVPILQSVVDRRRRVTPRHPVLAIVLGNLRGALIALGRFAEAEAILREAAEVSYAIELQGQQRWDEAERGYLAVLADRRLLDGGKPPSPMTQRTLALLARVYAKRQRWPEAAGLLSELILAQHPDPKRERDALAATLSAALTRRGVPLGLEPAHLAEWREALKVPLGVRDWLAAEVTSRYGDCLRRQDKDRFAEAEPIQVGAAHEIQRGVGVPSWSVTAARERVAELYEAWQKPADAAKWR